MLICSVKLCKKAIRYKRRFSDLVDHIIQYRFKSKEDRNYSAIVLSSIVIGYILGMLYLRIRTFKNPVDLNVIYTSIKDLYFKLPFGLFCYNIVILIILLYLFTISIKLVKKRLNIHLTKMHFYLMCFTKYKKAHYYFRDSISVDAFIIQKFTILYNKGSHYIISLYLFGYNKDLLLRNIKQKGSSLKLITFSGFKKKKRCIMLLRENTVILKTHSINH